jgi:uncharacterized membrane protein YdbT with pleckstrin-like domain
MDLAPGEHILFSGHPSWRSILGFYIKGVLVTVVAGALAAGITRIADDHVKWGIVAVVVIVLAALTVLVGLVKRISTTYTISNQRLSIQHGLLSRERQEARLDRVQNVNTRQSFLERILQVGTVDFDTAGSDDYDFSFTGVADPEDITKTVHLAQREATGGDGTAAPATATAEQPTSPQ